MKKKVDSRIRTLIENGVAQRHRTFIVLVGDKGKDQVRGLIRRVNSSLLWSPVAAANPADTPISHCV